MPVKVGYNFKRFGPSIRCPEGEPLVWYYDPDALDGKRMYDCNLTGEPIAYKPDNGLYFWAAAGSRWDAASAF